MSEGNLIWEGWNRAERERAATDQLIFGTGLMKEVGQAQMHIPIIDWYGTDHSSVKETNHE